MANKWLAHVKKTMKQMKSRGQYKKGDGLKKVILAAKKTYSKGKKGGADSDSDDAMAAPADAPAPAAVEGARRRRKTARKTRRHRK
jgi:hypothetical protein